MIRLLPLLSACLLIVQSAGSAANPEEASSSFVTRISDNLEIVTQVSNTKPFVGQQFTIIYSLRALRPPSAVDLDPQQYSGFWTELARLPEQPHSAIRLQNGRAVSEYLLRQVIAFPLWAGALDLAPLRVKVKNSPPRASSGDWDVIGTSIPIHITVRSLTPAQEYLKAPPLVGELEGSLSVAGPGVRSDLLLEVKGTANLALLQPKEWLRAPRAIRWSVRLKDWENTVQTRDTGDGRQLTLLQWRRWIIRPIGQQEGSLHIEDLVIPIFQPSQGHWSSVRIRGLDLSGASAVSSPEVMPTDPVRQATRPNRMSMWMIMGLPSLALLFLALLRLWLAAKTQNSER